MFYRELWRNPRGPENVIRNVWAANLYAEFALMRKIAKEYKLIGIDTEFPGTVAIPGFGGEFRSWAHINYETIRLNVNMLRPIQLGLSFMNSKGETPPGILGFQLHFKFNVAEDEHAENSIEFLKKCGVDFRQHAEEGIRFEEFSEYFNTTNFMFTDEVTWISFHGAYDYCYVMKLLLGISMPETLEEFYELFKVVFPVSYDLKFMMQIQHFRGGLQDLADQFSVTRIGNQHQAGSDSYLTGLTFATVARECFRHKIPEEYMGQLFSMELQSHDSSVPYDPIVINDTTYYSNPYY